MAVYKSIIHNKGVGRKKLPGFEQGSYNKNAFLQTDVIWLWNFKQESTMTPEAFLLHCRLPKTPWLEIGRSRKLHCSERNTTLITQFRRKWKLCNKLVYTYSTLVRDIDNCPHINPVGHMMHTCSTMHIRHSVHKQSVLDWFLSPPFVSSATLALR